jgi:hypothetical protein
MMVVRSLPLIVLSMLTHAEELVAAENLTRALRRERRKRLAAEAALADTHRNLLHSRHSTWQPRRALPCNATKHLERPRLSVLVQSFSDGANAQQLAARIHMLPLGLEVIVNDDSGRDHGEWLRWLHGPNDAVLSLPNVHEIRAYNRMARMARGDFLLLLQGDHCLPTSSLWLERGLRLFDRFPRLGLLGGQMGFDRVPLRKIAESVSWGMAPCKPIPLHVPTEVVSEARGEGGMWQVTHGGSSVAGEPFMFVAGVNIGPLLFRREAFLRVGGFDEAFSCAGEPGIQLDTDISLQLWRNGYHVGLWYAAVSNGVGGRKTRTNRAQKRVRLQNDALNGQRCQRVMRGHNAAAVTAANMALERIPQPERTRESTQAELGLSPAKSCPA